MTGAVTSTCGGRPFLVSGRPMFIRTLLMLALVNSFSVACDSKADDKKVEPKTTAAPAATPDAAKPAAAPVVETPPPAAAAGPVVITPKDLFAEWTKPDADGLALMTKYENGATFTGKLVTVSAEESGTPVLFMDVDGKSRISLGFTDVEPIKAKKLKVGDELTVTCKIGGAMDALMQVTDCVAK
jgi:hypothetical protein